MSPGTSVDPSAVTPSRARARGGRHRLQVLRLELFESGQAVPRAVAQDLCNGSDVLDATGDLTAQSDRRLHVAIEVETAQGEQFSHRVLLRVELVAAGPLCAKRPKCRAGVSVQHDRVGLGCVKDRLLPVRVDRGLGGSDHCGAELNSLGPEREGRGHRRPVHEPTGGDHRNIDLGDHQREQHHRGHGARVLEPAAFAALDDQSVDSGVHRLQRGVKRRNDVEHGEPGVLELGGVLGRTSRRGGHEADTLTDDEIDDRRILDEGLGDVHAEGSIGQIAHVADLFADHIQLPRGGLYDPHGSRVGHCGCERRSCDPPHRGLDDRDVDTEELSDTVGEHLLVLSPAMSVSLIAPRASMQAICGTKHYRVIVV